MTAGSSISGDGSMGGASAAPEQIYFGGGRGGDHRHDWAGKFIACVGDWNVLHAVEVRSELGNHGGNLALVGQERSAAVAMVQYSVGADRLPT